ncbi:MAG: hypothetical protein J6M62_00685 [Selenomonadaceae bacterium]|nr:hypothetical protein [Selenomonadaceae bacterium]
MEGYDKTEYEAIARKKWEESTIQNNFVFSKTMEIIFICPFAPFKLRKHIYTFQERCKEETSLLLGSETNKIILSTKGADNDISSELKNFLSYVETGVTADEYTREMNNAVRVIKNNEKARLDFMGYEMDLLEREIRGEKRGREQLRKEMSSIISKKDMEIAELKKQIAMMSESAKTSNI